MLSVLSVRAWLHYGLISEFDPEKVGRYSTFLVAGSAAAGVVWGLGGVIMFVPERLDYQLFILLSLLAMTGGSTFTLSNYLPAYFAYVPLTLLPISVKLLSLGDAIHISLCAVTLVFFAAMTVFNLKINRNFQLSYQLRYENTDLIEQLRTQTAEADRANKAKSKFLAAASHDLRQPLYAMSLFLETLETMKKSDEVSLVVGKLTSAANSLNSLLDALLDISKLDAGVVRPKLGSVGLKALFDNLKNNYDPLATEAGIYLLWPEDEGYVHSEPELLEQILRNLISNAIRHTTRGGITIMCNRTLDLVEILVADTGAGIPEDEIHTIFEEFHQLETPANAQTKGLGLGLAIAKRAASLLDVEIKVESALGKGSVFSVTLPSAKVSIDQVQNVQELGSTNALTGAYVVLIDDDPLVLKGLDHLLSAWQYSTLLATDTNSVIKQLEAGGQTPLAIISDYGLGDNKTGTEAINTIREMFNKEIPALLVTGETNQELLLELDKGSIPVLHKPAAPAKLRAFLRSSEQILTNSN